MSNQIMRGSAAALVLAMAVGGPACAAAPSFDLQVTRLGSGSESFVATSGFTAPTSIVVRDQAALDALWNSIYANTTPRPATPTVDFSKHLIIARAMGPRPTGGYSVVIAGMIRQGQEYIVQIRETQPGPTCVVTLAVTSPVDVARVARHDDPIKFAISTDTRTCAP